jgi:hypothetical protein
MKNIVLVTAFIALFALEILRIYFIMPFPGSQQANTVEFAFWLHNNIFWIRMCLLLVLVYSMWHVFKTPNKVLKSVSLLLLLIYGVLFFMANYKLQADKMFEKLKQNSFASIITNKVKLNKLVIGVSLNGEAKAYPLQQIGYHHQVLDTVGGIPIMVTYCTVCRTGRVFSPIVNGKPEVFRLVGMDHFNAMFEDASTKSWWQQATGVAVAGKLKGTKLSEIPAEQSTLGVWLSKYPTAYILQENKTYAPEYKDLAFYDDGTIESGLEKRDSASWKPKSWVIGIKHQNIAKAYDWNILIKKRIIEDSISDLKLLITLQKDKASYHIFNRNVSTKTLNFNILNNNKLLDMQTKSTWNNTGLCISGPLKGMRLLTVQAYQEFWHSWKNFNPKTQVFK